ncbi:MAG: hypothetical protein KGL11_08720 [Alphaproteobacteria bacterium]|nr:hypothetical protein [Alphaproteobacteria bacterium]
MTLFLDVSVALAWKFRRDDPDEARHASTVLDALENDTALVPALWHIEVANALVTAQRRGALADDGKGF